MKSKQSRKIQYLKNLNKKFLGKFNINTSKVIISNERILHIQNHHSNLKNYEFNYINNILSNPDYVFSDKKNKDTILLVKYIPTSNQYYLLVVKLNTNKKLRDKANTIISFWSISSKKLNQLIRNEEIIYKKLDKYE